MMTRGGSRALARREQGFDLGAARGRHAAAQARAFEAGRRCGEPQRRDHVAAFRERERERAVEHVAGAQRVDRLNRKDRAPAQRGALAPEHVPRALGDGEKRRCRAGNPGERGAEVVETGDHSQQWLDRFAAEVGAMPEVMEFYRMAGDVDYMLRVVVPDIAGYDSFYKRLIAAVPLKNVTSRFAMEKIKATTALPIP